MEEDADSEPLVRPVPVSSRDEVPTVLAVIITLIELCKNVTASLGTAFSKVKVIPKTKIVQTNAVIPRKHSLFI